MFREGASGGGPRPLDDAELDAVAGGNTWTVHFPDGCTVQATADNLYDALDAANFAHATMH